MTQYTEPKYRKDELRRLSWDEYGRTLEILYKKVSKYLKEKRMSVDAVVPIFRGGAVPGTYLAYRLRVLAILPVQYKYLYIKGKGELRRLFAPDMSSLKGIKRPVLLLVENNHFSGATARAAVKDLKKVFPKARILYAAARADYTNWKIGQVSVQFYGRLTNETRELTRKEADRRKITNWISVFPWESFEEELNGMNLKDFNYSNLEQIKGDSKPV